jgi:hypothetical protein
MGLIEHGYGEKVVYAEERNHDVCASGHVYIKQEKSCILKKYLGRLR